MWWRDLFFSASRIWKSRDLSEAFKEKPNDQNKDAANLTPLSLSHCTYRTPLYFEEEEEEVKVSYTIIYAHIYLLNKLVKKFTAKNEK